MTLLVGLLLVAVFLAFAGAMFQERLSALLALPLMALAFAAIAAAATCLDAAPSAVSSGEPLAATSNVAAALLQVLRDGPLALSDTIIATLFGGMFAAYVRTLKIAERMVTWAAEFAGDRPALLCVIMLVAVAAVFTSTAGLGTVIMLGTIVLPVLRSVGVGPIGSSGVLLIGVAMGGTLNPVARRLWQEFYGLPPAQIDTMLYVMVGLYLACGLGWIVLSTRRSAISRFHAVAATAATTAAAVTVPARLMIAPLVPVLLVFVLAIHELAAFALAIAYMYLCVCRRGDATRELSRSLIEGAQSVIPPVLLMIGIGMLIVSLRSDAVQAYMTPLIAATAPSSAVGYIVTFIVAAPLALYRGPLNVWGMGLAVSATLMTASSLPAAAVLGVVLAAGMLQGICDPTNTANVWVAGFQGITVNQLLRRTILPVWMAAAAGIAIFGLMFVGS